MSCLSLLIAISLHVGLEYNYNNIHPHARCTIDNTISGAYYNSEEQISYYIGKKIPNIDKGWDLEIGLVTGYSGADVVPLVRYINDGWFISPSYETTGSIGIIFGYELGL